MMVVDCVMAHQPTLDGVHQESERIATRNAERVQACAGHAIASAIRLASSAASSGQPVRQKLQQMRFAAGQWSAAIAPFTACAKACSHCCKIGVAVSAEEAALIGKRIGVKPAANVVLTGVEEELDKSRFRGVPCPFLGDRGCQIYSDRPFLCRTHINMDSKEDLCSTHTDSIVPYANAVVLKGCYGYVADKGKGLADIRDWFPRGLGAAAVSGS